MRKTPLCRTTISAYAFASQDSLRNVNQIGEIAHQSTNNVIMKNNSVYPESHVETKSIGSFVSRDSTRNLQEIVHREVHGSSLRRLSKHWKMLLIMLIPVLSLLALVTNNLLKAAEVKKTSGLVITEVNIAQKVAGLIQMLQRERGISATYLSAVGNKTEALITMLESRQSTDSAFTDVFVVNRHLVDINGKPHTAAMLKEIVLLARERIENGSVLVEGHLTFYTDLNNGLMNVMFKDISLSGDQSYFADIIAFSSLIRWTDIIGLLRARIAFQYATCGFDTITLQIYMLLTGQAQAYKIIFTSYSNLMMNEFSKQKQSTEEYLYEVRNTAWNGSFRNSCLTLSKKERLSLGLNWFKNITKFIDFAFEIKEKQSRILTNKMLSTRAQAEHEFNLYLSVQIITTVLSFILTSWYIVCIDKLTFKIAKHTITIKSKTQELMVEKRLTEKLLFQMLPKKIAITLKERGTVSAEYFSEVSVLFSDIVNFTELGSRSSPLQIIDLLNGLYGLFDDHIEKYDVYKVETIGDAYMVASGVPVLNGNAHASQICHLALDLQQLMSDFRVPCSFQREENVQIRIGIHSGPCVAGVVGRKMPRYCLFGDTINTASRMESTGQGGRIHLSSVTYDIIQPLGVFRAVLRGVVQVKGKGQMTTYWLVSSSQKAAVRIDDSVPVT